MIEHYHIYLHCQVCEFETFMLIPETKMEYMDRKFVGRERWWEHWYCKACKLEYFHDCVLAQPIGKRPVYGPGTGLLGVKLYLELKATNEWTLNQINCFIRITCKPIN